MRKILLPIMLAAACAMPAAHAVSISRASTVSVSRAPAPARAPTAAPSRIGGGQTVGMTRPELTKPATIPVAGVVPRAPAPAAVQTPGQVTQSAPSAGSTFMAAAGGSFLGSVLGNAVSHPSSTTVVSGGGVPAVAAAGGATVVPAPAVVSSGTSWASFLLTCFLFAIAAFIAWRLYHGFKREKAWRHYHPEASDSVSSPLPFSPVDKFLAVQSAYAKGDRAQLAGMLGPDAHQLLDSLPVLDLQRPCTVRGVSYTLLDWSAGVISIHYRALDTETDERLSEIWHFIAAGDAGLLNGIEQVV